MEVEPPLRELAHLGKPARDRDARHRVAAEVFQRAADEVAHLDQRLVGQAVETCGGGLAGGAGAGGDVPEPRRARDVDAAMDGRDPGGTGIGDHHAGGAQDRQAAHDAEAAVQRAGRKRRAAGDRDRDLSVRQAGGEQGGRDHGARHRVDRGLSGRQRQARARDGADPLARPENDAAPCVEATDGGAHQGAVGDVGVVAGILHHARLRGVARMMLLGQREVGSATSWEGDRHGIGERAAAHDCGRGRRGRGCRARPRRPAAPQMPIAVHATEYSGRSP